MYANEDYVLDLLKEAALVTEDQIENARTKLQMGETLIDSLKRLKVVDSAQVSQTCAFAAQMDFIDLAHHAVSPDAINAVPADQAVRYRIAPVDIGGGRLRVAVSDPLNFETLDALPHILPFELDIVCATPENIQDLLTQHYGDADAAIRNMEKRLGTALDAEEEAGDQLGADDAPIIKMVSHMLLEAFKAGASDIHVEPLETELRIRYRVDGVLHEVARHPKKLHNAVMTRMKIMTGTMSIDEKRVPQDGKIQVPLQDRVLDLRVSSVPTNHGESIVMRILDKTSLKLGLSDLGFFSDDQEHFEGMLSLPDGILLVTGPTGSGKTTTLYACLNYINRPDRKIITVEDPVEYELAGINQVSVKSDIGMTFPAALRAILRQAPNIIMIGEIRDAETATIAINASLTGHLVFSTLHTNDAPSAVARLTDIGIKPFLISSSVRAIMAQRLVRKLCPQCKAPALLNEKEMRVLALDETQVAEATVMGHEGCGNCRETGYKGRVALIEIFTLDDEVRAMVNEHLSTPALRRRARELGMRTLREDGVRKVLVGSTTAAEVLRVTMGDDG